MSMARMTKMVGFTVPPMMADELERMADEEQRTKSELFREMFRLYRSYRQQKREQEEASLDRLVAQALLEAQATSRTDEEVARSMREIARYGNKRAQALRLTESDVNRIVYEERQKRRAEGGD